MPRQRQTTRNSRLAWAARSRSRRRICWRALMRRLPRPSRSARAARSGSRVMARATACNAGMRFEHGRVRGAARAGLEAAWMEAAAAGRICRARDLALQDETSLRAHARRAAARRRAAPACRDASACRRCADLALSSTMRPRYMTATRSEMWRHHRKVVGDEQIGEAELVLQVLQQVDDLGLDRDVERGDRLVENEQARLQRQCPRDADALLLPARELARQRPATDGERPTISNRRRIQASPPISS